MCAVLRRFADDSARLADFHQARRDGQAGSSNQSPVGVVERLIPPAKGSGTAALDTSFNPGGPTPGIVTERDLLISVGAGYSWGCAVVEILSRPAWAGQ